MVNTNKPMLQHHLLLWELTRRRGKSKIAKEVGKMTGETDNEVWIDESGLITAESLQAVQDAFNNMTTVVDTTTIAIDTYNHIVEDFTKIDLKKPVKRTMKKSRDADGRLWELHPTKGWRRVRRSTNES